MQHQPSQLRSVVENDGQRVRVRLMGHLDIATLPRFRRLLGGLVERQPPSVVLDLSGIEVMEHAAAAYLAGAQQTAQHRGVHLEIEGATGFAAVLLRRAAARFAE